MVTVDFLKIDIEGAEAPLFSEAGRPGDWLPHVACLRYGMIRIITSL